MAKERSSQNAYQWPDGSWHSNSWVEHQQNLAAAAVKDQGPGAQMMAAGGAYYKTTGIPDPNAKPAPAAAPQPFDPTLEAAKQGATWNVQTAGAEGTYQKGQLAYNTGFNADGSVNSANPYSQATLLQDSYKRNVAGTDNSMASSGQLYSGARLNAQARNDRNYAQGYDALKRGTADQYHKVDYGTLQTYGQNALGVNDADYQALRRAIYGGS